MMKKLMFFLALHLFLGFSVVAAQDVDKMPAISVMGTAEIEVQPDEVTLILEVTKLDKDLQTAKRLNDESVAKILELTRRFAILPQNAKTDFISVEMKYESIRDPKTKIYSDSGDEIGKRVFTGYSVSKTVLVKLTDISRFEEFFSEVLKTGLTEVNSVSFGTSKLRENKDKARDMAMKAAREKATAMASSIGQTIGKAVKINEGYTVAPYYPSNANILNSNSNASNISGSFSQGVATFAPGAIKIDVQVSVSFLLN